MVLAILIIAAIAASHVFLRRYLYKLVGELEARLSELEHSLVEGLQARAVDKESIDT